jgi:hypothetical protein
MATGCRSKSPLQFNAHRLARPDSTELDRRGVRTRLGASYRSCRAEETLRIAHRHAPKSRSKVTKRAFDMIIYSSAAVSHRGDDRRCQLRTCSQPSMAVLILSCALHARARPPPGPHIATLGKLRCPAMVPAATISKAGAMQIQAPRLLSKRVKKRKTYWCSAPDCTKSFSKRYNLKVRPWWPAVRSLSPRCPSRRSLYEPCSRPLVRTARLTSACTRARHRSAAPGTTAARSSNGGRASRPMPSGTSGKTPGRLSASVPQSRRRSASRGGRSMR